MNRLARPVMFAMEPDLVFVFARVTFGASGAPTLDTNHSKGICNITRNSIAFVADTDGLTAVLANVVSFAGLYVGMAVTGTGIAANSVISSMDPGASTITLNNNTTSAHAAGTLHAAGGQYTIQFGAQAAVRLDNYVKLLSLNHNWDESGLQGGATTAASSPAAPAMFLVGNNISIRTIPPTSAASLTDATLQIQFGGPFGSSGVFQAADPANGEVVRLAFVFTRSTAV